jgi:hypothetical protein
MLSEHSCLRARSTPWSLSAIVTKDLMRSLRWSGTSRASTVELEGNVATGVGVCDGGKAGSARATEALTITHQKVVEWRAIFEIIRMQA